MSHDPHFSKPGTPALEPDDPKLDQYLAGRLGPSDTQAIESAIVASSAWRSFVRVVRWWLTDPDLPAPPAAADAYQRFVQRIPVTTPTPSHDRLYDRPAFGRRGTGGIRGTRAMSPSVLMRRAGVVAGVLGVVAAFVLVVRKHGHDVPVTYGATYRTAVGEQKVITLTDSTHVMLAPSSVLRVATAFGATTRIVDVVGEAVFDVPRAAGVPFIVHAGATTTRVLGTRFAVRHDIQHDAHHTTVQVVVLNGKVELADSHHRRTTVSRGYTLVSTDSATMLAQTTDSSFTDWTSGRMEFTHAPVSRVLAAVGRWYGIAFKLADSGLATRHLTATIDVHDSRAVTLAGLESVLGVDMQAVGDTITLVTRTSARKPPTPRRDEHGPWTTTREVGR